MYYPCFTKVIIDYFMAKDQAIPRRNKMFWHYDRDDFMFTTIRVISKHKDTQEYGAILPEHLTNQAMLESEAFKTYRAYATGEKAPKSKATKKKTDSESSPKTKPSQASKGKRIKTSAKEDKPATTKSKGLTVLSEVALSEAEQMKLATKRSMKEFHISHASGSGDGVDILSKVPDEQQQTRSGTNKGAGDQPEHDSDDDNDDNDDEDDDQEAYSRKTKSDDSGDDFVHPNLSTYKADEEKLEKEEEKAKDDDEVISDQKVSTLPDYGLSEEDENQQDDDTIGVNTKKMKKMRTCNNKAPLFHQIWWLNSLSIFGYKVSSLEIELSKLKQTNQFAEAVASIPGIVDKYLTSKMKDEVNVALQLKSDKLREEAQAENHDFLNLLDSNMKRIIKEQKFRIPAGRGVFHSTNDQLDWYNPEGRPYLSKPFPLILDARVKWIEDKIPRSTWSEVQVVYDKHAYWGTYHLGPKCQRFYGYATNMENSKDVYSKHRIIAVTCLKIMEFFGYTHLEEITGKLTNLNVDERFALNVALKMYTRCIVIQERVEDLQLAVERYQKKINLTKPDTYRSDISKKTPYTAYQTQRQEVDAKSRKVYWWKTLQRRPSATTKDHMIQSYDVLIIQVISRYRRIRKDGGEVIEFQRSFRHSDTERLSRSDKVFKLKNFKKDATLKLFNSTNQEKYEHVGPKSEVPQDGKVTRWRNEIMLG
ncbi:hypothetical protein Tco_0748737 [Tanacetum coccineum]|uniref:Uncharacterized protein n=1 Tax=Tanacetum coccineum TaxID=301880 RepID=A0ABQ4YXM3_9ASTR